MSWFETATNFASNVATGAVDSAWEGVKETVFGGEHKDTAEAEKASIPDAQSSNEKGQGTAKAKSKTKVKKPINWQAAGVIVAGITLLTRFL